jgi:prepilin peptidase CpaA
MQFASLAIRIVVLGILLWLAVADVRTRRLPTRPVLFVALLFFADAGVNRMSLHVVAAHVASAAAVFVICAVLFFSKMLGGGDAKLAAAIFLWVGFGLSVEALSLISVIGMVVALVSVATRRLHANERSGFLRVLAMFSGACGVPYGVALALGGGTIIVAPPILSLVLTR